MNSRSTPATNHATALAGALFALGLCATQLADAHGDRRFTEASLQGSYAYVNNSGGVASFGPMTFDGRGGLTLTDRVNLPCANQQSGCVRVIADLTAEGTYTVNADGTGVATIQFTDSDGNIRSPDDVFDFVISKATWRGRRPLATEVFAAGRFGGLNGQLVAPTWTRLSD